MTFSNDPQHIQMSFIIIKLQINKSMHTFLKQFSKRKLGAKGRLVVNYVIFVVFTKDMMGILAEAGNWY